MICNKSNELNYNERNPKTTKVWNYINLNKLIDIIYTNKIYLLFSILSFKNFTIKYICLTWNNYEIDDFELVIEILKIKLLETKKLRRI